MSDETIPNSETWAMKALSFVCSSWKPKHLELTAPGTYVGMYKRQRIMLRFRDHRWQYYVNESNIGWDWFPRGAEKMAIRDVDTYFVRGEAA